MNTYVRYLLPVYFLLYLLFLVIIRSMVVKKEAGKNPVVLSKKDDAHGLIARYFLYWMLALASYTVLFSFFPASNKYFYPINYLDTSVMKIAGMAILIISLVWTYIAQGDMRGSWRIGIDHDVKTNLVTSGIFRYSRNPIYLGMMASVTGLVMVTPCALTVTLLIIGFVLIQVQVRLEEDFLFKMHGANFAEYMRTVPRFI